MSYSFHNLFYKKLPSHPKNISTILKEIILKRDSYLEQKTALKSSPRANDEECKEEIAKLSK